MVVVAVPHDVVGPVAPHLDSADLDHGLAFPAVVPVDVTVDRRVALDAASAFRLAVAPVPVPSPVVGIVVPAAVMRMAVADPRIEDHEVAVAGRSGRRRTEARCHQKKRMLIRLGPVGKRQPVHARTGWHPEISFRRLALSGRCAAGTVRGVERKAAVIGIGENAVCVSVIARKALSARKLHLR